MTCSDALLRLVLAHRIKRSVVAAQANVSSTTAINVINGKAAANPRVVDAVCDLAGVDEFHRKMLHEMGAREYGWKV